MRRLDERVHAPSAGAGRDRDADLAQDGRGQAVACDGRPRLAFVGGLVKTAAGAAALHVPGLPLHLPQRGEHRRGIVGIGRELDRAAQRVLVEHLRPGAPAVGRAEHAALFVRAIDMALCGDQHHIGVARIDHDARDVPGVVEPRVRPGPAGVGGLPHAVAERCVLARGGLAGADVDDVRVRGRYRDGANRPERARAVEDRRPHVAAVGGLPHPAQGGADVVGFGRRRDTGDGGQAAAAKRADLAPGEASKERRGDRTLRRRRSQHPGERQAERDERSEHGEDLGDERVTDVSRCIIPGRPRAAGGQTPVPSNFPLPV